MEHEHLIVNSFKTEQWLSDAMAKYIKSHHLKKSDFIREAVIRYLEDMSDIEAFERTKNDKIYSLEEVKRGLGLEN